MSVGASGKVLASSPIQQPDAVGPETQSLPTASSAGRHVFAEREPARIKVRRESALATRLQTSFWRPATTWWACQLLDSAGREAKGSRDIITAHLAVLSLPSRCPCVLQEPKASPSHKVLNMPTILFSVQSPDATEQEIVRGALPLQDHEYRQFLEYTKRFGHVAEAGNFSMTLGATQGPAVMFSGEVDTQTGSYLPFMQGGGSGSGPPQPNPWVAYYLVGAAGAAPQAAEGVYDGVNATDRASDTSDDDGEGIAVLFARENDEPDMTGWTENQI